MVLQVEDATSQVKSFNGTSGRPKRPHRRSLHPDNAATIAYYCATQLRAIASLPEGQHPLITIDLRYIHECCARGVARKTTDTTGGSL